VVALYTAGMLCSVANLQKTNLVAAAPRWRQPNQQPAATDYSQLGVQGRTVNSLRDGAACIDTHTSSAQLKPACSVIHKTVQAKSACSGICGV
jgi:hypothetical protein